MTRSDSIANLAAALVAAQGELKNPAFDSKNPHFKNAYASLQSVRDTVTPVLAKHGLAVTQLLGASEHGPCCETMLVHKSGEFLASTLALPVDRNNAQGYGSAFSYARRYALMAIVGVVGEPDDDGNQASKEPARPAAGIHIPANRTATVELSAEREQHVKEVLLKVLDWFAADSADDAYLELENAGLDADEKVYLWNFLDSKQRSAIKAAGKNMRKEPA